jgi:hypothetical protein
MAELSHLRHEIAKYHGSFVYVCDSDADTAVVFVHGWDGDALDTWLNFPFLISSGAASPNFWKRSDAFFFDYDGVNEHLETSKVFLKRFLRSIFPVPDREIFTAKIPWPTENPEVSAIANARSYKSLFLVGHSAGAVLIRMIIRDDLALLEQDTTWTRQLVDAEYRHLQAELRLFAPAIGGKRVASAAGIISGLPIFSALLNFSRAHNDLLPPSDLLNNLRTHTEEFQRNYPTREYSLPCLRAQIVFGTLEEVVQPAHYLQDTLHPPRQNKNHGTICKPKPDYLFPLEFISDATKTATA